MKTVKSNKMYKLYGVTKKHGLLQTSTWLEIVVLSKRSRLSLKQILLEEEEKKKKETIRCLIMSKKKKNEPPFLSREINLIT